MQQGNLFEALAANPVAEQLQPLASGQGLRIERIVSLGQASPPDFWYQQAECEWVVLLSGAARLRFAEPEALYELQPGDWLEIPAGRRHRVEWTDPQQPCIWLALFYSK